MQTPQAIISDADGTLIDTLHLIRHGLFETTVTYLRQHGVAEDDLPTYEEYESTLNHSVGGSSRDTIEKTARLFYENQPHHIDSVDFNELHDGLNAVQDGIAPAFVKPYAGLGDLLTLLGKLHIKFAIFTSGSPYHVVRNFGVALPELGLATLFQDASIDDHAKLRSFEAKLQEYFALPAFTVVTCEDVSAHKPDPESLFLAMERLSVKPEATLVLGDHRVDMQSGVNAGSAYRVGITHGFDDQDLLIEAGATHIIDSLAELGKMLGQTSA